jgi:hypothetical protein
MAGKKMTPAQLKALVEAGKFFGDPKLGKKRIADFKKTLADGYAGLTVNPQTKPKNPGSPSDAAGRAKAKNPGSPSDAAARAIAGRAKAKNPGSPLAAAQRELKGRTTRPGRGAR